MTKTTWLSEVEDLDRDDAIGWLRRIVDITRDLCDAVEDHIGPERPAALGMPLGPAATFVTAATAPYLELLANWAWDRFGQDAKRRIEEMLARAWQAAGLDAIKFSKGIGRTERTRQLTAAAMTGAAATAWPPRVAALGKLLGEGLLTEDDDELDITALALAATAEMERPHVVLLNLLVNEPDGEATGRRAWTADQIRAAAPQLTPALTGLIGTLVRHGLAAENNNAAEPLEKSLQAFNRRGREQTRLIRAGSRLTTASMLPHVPDVPRIVQTWSSTPLGERILGFYREAAGGGQADTSQQPPSATERNSDS